MRILLTALALLISLPSIADDANRLRFSGVTITKKQTRKISKVIARVDERLRGMGISEEPLEIQISKSGTNAFFAPGTPGRLEIPLAFMKYDEKLNLHELNRTTAHAVLAHEYGHWYFERFMLTNEPLWIDARQAMKENREQTETLKKEYDALVLRQLRASFQRKAPNLIKSETPSESKTETELKDETEAALKKYYDHAFLKNETYDTAVPYNELFADFVSVVALKDGSAMREVELQRDFTKPISAMGLSPKNPHTYLAPTRAFIWSYYLSTHIRDDDFSAFATTLLRAIQSELRDRLADPSLKILSAADANSRLIEKISVLR